MVVIKIPLSISVEIDLILFLQMQLVSSEGQNARISKSMGYTNKLLKAVQEDLLIDDTLLVAKH